MSIDAVICLGDDRAVSFYDRAIAFAQQHKVALLFGAAAVVGLGLLIFEPYDPRMRFVHYEDAPDALMTQRRRRWAQSKTGRESALQATGSPAARESATRLYRAREADLLTAAEKAKKTPTKFLLAERAAARRRSRAA